MGASDRCTGGCISKLTDIQTADSIIIVISVMGTIPCKLSVYIYIYTGMLVTGCVWQYSKSACSGLTP